MAVEGEGFGELHNLAEALSCCNALMVANCLPVKGCYCGAGKSL